MYTFLILSAFFNAIMALIAGVIIYANNSKNLVNKTFAFLCFCFFLWSIGYFFPITLDSHDLSLLSFRLLHVGAIFIGIAHFHFICAILNIVKKKKKLIVFGYTLNALFLFSLPTTFFIKDVVPKYNFPYWAEIGPLYPIWLVFWTAFIAYSVYLLFSFYKTSIGIKKQQIKYILIGEIITIIFGMTNYFLFFNINIPPYLTILSSGHIILFAYVIARYRFFDFQFTLLDTLKKIFAISITLLSGYFLHASILTHSRFSIIGIMVSSLLIYFVFSKLFETSIFHRFFHLDRFKYFQNTIDKFRKKIASCHTLPILQKEIQTVFVKLLRLSSGRIVLLTKKSRTQYPKLIKYFEETREFIIIEELEFNKALKDITPQLEKELFSLEGSICFPLFHGTDNIVGLFVLGAKPFGNPYGKEELELLNGAAHYITLSLLSIIYNEELQKEVETKTMKLRAQTKDLKKAYKELEKLDEMKDSFLSVASHELRTPMTVIKGYSDFLLSGKFGKLTAQQKDFEEKIFNNTQQLLELVNDLLDLSKLDAERMEFNYDFIDINKFLKDDALANFNILCAEKKITLSLKMELKDTKIFTDSDKIKRIINNLVGNAYKFTPKKGKITVSVRQSKKDPKMIRFEVTDTGIGIKKEDMGKIFEKFSQLGNYLQKSYNGTGLGLPIVKKIIEKMEGEIWVESKFNKGSHFIFLLPYKQPKK